jgi:hypothetical protein
MEEGLVFGCTVLDDFIELDSLDLEEMGLGPVEVKELGNLEEEDDEEEFKGFDNDEEKAFEGFDG